MEISDKIGAETFGLGDRVDDLNADGYDDVLSRWNGIWLSLRENSVLLNERGKRFLTANSFWESNRARTGESRRSPSFWTVPEPTKTIPIARVRPDKFRSARR